MAACRTYFFDVKTSHSGGKFLIITESRIKEKQRSQIVVFLEAAQQFVQTIGDMVALLQH
jgi:hypothetical protein